MIDGISVGGDADFALDDISTASITTFQPRVRDAESRAQSQGDVKGRWLEPSWYSERIRTRKYARGWVMTTLISLLLQNPCQTVCHPLL